MNELSIRIAFQIIFTCPKTPSGIFFVCAIYSLISTEISSSSSTIVEKQANTETKRKKKLKAMRFRNKNAERNPYKLT